MTQSRKVLLVGQSPTLARQLREAYSHVRFDESPALLEALQLSDSDYELILFRFTGSSDELTSFVEKFDTAEPVWCCTLSRDETQNVRQVIGVEVSRLFRHPPEEGQVVRQLQRYLRAHDQPERSSSEDHGLHQVEMMQTFLRVNRARIANVLLHFERGTVDANRVELQKEVHKLSGTLGTFGFMAGTAPAQRMEEILKAQVSLAPEDLESLRRDALFLQQLLESEHPVEVGAPQKALPLVACFTPDEALRLDMVARAADYRFRVVTPPISELIELCAEAAYDLVAVDFGQQIGKLPTDLLDCLKTLPCPVVAVCKEPTLEHRLVMVDWGVDTVLPGPVSGRELAETAASYLQAPDGTRIMALDDDPLMLARLESILAPLKVSFFPLSEPAELWEQVQARSPDLLLLDYDLTSVNGVQLCRAIKACPAHRELAVAFVSANPDPRVQVDAWEAGAIQFVPKTLPPREFGMQLLQVVRKVRDSREHNVDPLTGLNNRALASKAIKSFLGLGSRRSLPVSLAIIDLDHFKSINDRFGHPVGDSVLKTVAGVLRTTLRSEDVVCRWGGEEFVVAMFLFDKRQAKERLETALERVRSQLHTTDDERSFQVTFSAGVAQFPIDGTDLDTLYERADQALYTAKARGRSQVVSASEIKPLSEPVDVVLVEDDHPLGSAVIGELEARGLHCVWFQTAEELRQAMLCQAPYLKTKVLIVDKGLGLVDGLSIVREIRTGPRHQDTRVITCSSQMTDDEIEGAFQMGVFEHVSKPFALPVLCRQVKRAMART